MNGDASNRLSVTRSFRHDLADAVGSPGAGVVYLRGVYLRPQSPHLGLAHVPTNISPENLHFQWLLRNKPTRNEISRTPSPPSRRDLLRRLAPCFSFPSRSPSLSLPGPVSPVFSFCCSFSFSTKPKIEAGNQPEFAPPFRNLRVSRVAKQRFHRWCERCISRGKQRFSSLCVVARNIDGAKRRAGKPDDRHNFSFDAAIYTRLCKTAEST